MNTEAGTCSAGVGLGQVTEAAILLSGSHAPYAQSQEGPGDYPSLSQATRMLGGSCQRLVIAARHR